MSWAPAWRSGVAQSRQPRPRDAEGLQPEISSFWLYLAAEGKSATTVRTYTGAVQWFRCPLRSPGSVRAWTGGCREGSVVAPGGGPPTLRRAAARGIRCRAWNPTDSPWDSRRLESHGFSVGCRGRVPPDDGATGDRGQAARTATREDTADHGHDRELAQAPDPAGAAAVAAVAGLALAGAVLGGPAANADTIPNGATVDLLSTPVPATPPAYAASTSTATDGGALPDQNGQMGNPVQLTMTSGQVLAVQGGSTAWGTPVATENSTGDASETWRFQRVGWVDVTAGNTFVNSDWQPLFGEPVYKIVNYNPDGSYTCLDANGNDIAEGGAITSYGCDPNELNQTNQLWIVAGNEGDPASTHDLADPDGACVAAEHGRLFIGQELHRHDRKIAPTGRQLAGSSRAGTHRSYWNGKVR